jgi:uncharacterized protein YndB with AHSA1/START domain
MPALGPVSVTVCFALEWKRALAYPVARVWRALTDATEVAQWMGYPAQLEPQVGGRYGIDFRPEGGTLAGVVVTWDPERVLMCTGYGDTGDHTLLRWELVSRDRGTLLTFSQRGLSRPYAAGGGAGWDALVQQLERHLDGDPPLAGDAGAAAYRAAVADHQRRIEQALATERDRDTAV